MSSSTDCDPSCSAPQLRGRSTKKKGGYVIGRLMTWDGSCAWVQIGWQTVKVDRAQMRPAYGFESWTPDDEDIRALKSAEKNFLEGEVSDERGPVPPEDEPHIPEIADYGTQAVAPHRRPGRDRAVPPARGSGTVPAVRGYPVGVRTLTARKLAGAWFGSVRVQATLISGAFAGSSSIRSASSRARFARRASQEERRSHS